VINHVQLLKVNVMNFLLHWRAVLTIVLCLGAGVLAPSLNANTSSDEPAAQGFVRHLDKLRDKLHLTPQQQALWDLARRKSIEAQAQVGAGKHAMTDLSETELERTIPDLGMIARRLEALEQRNLALNRETRALWLKVYETLAPERIAVVREALRSELRRYKVLQSLRERFFG
jgi:hypothetical protein